MGNKYELTQEAKKFITNVCSNYKNDNECLSGKMKYELPYSNTGNNYIWTSNVKYNNVEIKNNKDLAKAIIDWYNYYAKIFEIDANILAAQAYIESAYKLWVYAETSTASGINQFTIPTIIDVIIKNKINENDNNKKFTENEINKITKYITSDLTNTNTYKSPNNRIKLHQNVIDNPDIMIKAQFTLIEYHGRNCDYLASSCLFGYCLGHKFAKKTLQASYNEAKNDPMMYKYLPVAIKYVNDIFNLLLNNFGYKDIINPTDFIDEYSIGLS